MEEMPRNQDSWSRNCGCDSLLLGNRFVEGLSKSHKAAPTEYQLLGAVRDRCAQRRPGCAALWQRELRKALKCAETDPEDAIAILLSTDAEALDLFSETQEKGKWQPKQLLLLVALSPTSRQRASAACADLGLTMASVRIADGSGPSAAVLLQFMHYCNELAPALRTLRRHALAA
ncbi:unnamed protein product, partial [Symbiodinium pilosum]